MTPSLSTCVFYPSGPLQTGIPFYWRCPPWSPSLVSPLCLAYALSPVYSALLAFFDGISPSRPAPSALANVSSVTPLSGLCLISCVISPPGLLGGDVKIGWQQLQQFANGCWQGCSHLQPFSVIQLIVCPNYCFIHLYMHGRSY